MKKLMLLSAVLLGTVAASQAGVGVHIDLPLPPLPPLPGIVIEHRAPRAYVEERPVYYAPPRRVYVAPPVVCAPPPVYCEPRVACAPEVVIHPRHPGRFIRHHGS